MTASLSGDKAYVSRAADLGSIPAFAADLFPGRVIRLTSKLIGGLLATLPGVLCCRVNAGTGWPGVSMM